jgi:hypothetical protein
MTDRAVDVRPSDRARRRGALGVVWTAIVVFLIVVALLAVRVSSGQDPALRAHAAATPIPPRRVLLRRIYERRVIVHLPPSAPPQPTRASEQVSSAAGPATSALVTRTS